MSHNEESTSRYFTLNLEYEIKDIVESGGGVARQSLCFVVPSLVHAGEIHPVAQVDARRNGQVFEYREGGLDRQAVVDA